MGPITLNSEGSAVHSLGTNPFRMKTLIRVPTAVGLCPGMGMKICVWKENQSKTAKESVYTTFCAPWKHGEKLGRHLSWRTIIYLQTAGMREQQCTAKARRKRWSFTDLWKEMVSPQAGNLCFFIVYVISLSQFHGRAFVYLDIAWCLHDTNFGCTVKHRHKIMFQYPYISLIYGQQSFKKE